MGTMLNIVGRHQFKDEVTPRGFIDLALKLNQAIERGFQEALDETEIYFTKNFSDPELSIYLDSIGNGGFLRVYKENFVFSSHYKFHEYVYASKAGTRGHDHFSDFRKDIYKLLKILGCQEIIYLCDGARILHEYLNLIETGTSYEEVYQLLKRRFGKPITNLAEINDPSEVNNHYSLTFLKEQFKNDHLNPENPFSFYDRLNEFIVDSYQDMQSNEKVTN